MTPNLRSGDAVGSYGETLRLDLNGDYGDLGANLQSVKWTFYGDDSTYTTPVKLMVQNLLLITGCINQWEFSLV